MVNRGTKLVPVTIIKNKSKFKEIKENGKRFNLLLKFLKDDLYETY